MRENLKDGIDYIIAGLVLYLFIVTGLFAKNWATSGFESDEAQFHYPLMFWGWVIFAVCVVISLALPPANTIDSKNTRAVPWVESTRPLPSSDPEEKDLPVHERVYNAAYDKVSRDVELSEWEEVTFNCFATHMYLDADGLDTGLGNFDHSRARAALPSLKEIGLDEVTYVLESYITLSEDMMYGRREMAEFTYQDKEAGTVAFLSYSDDVYDELVALGFDEIPDRLDSYLKGKSDT